MFGYTVAPCRSRRAAAAGFFSLGCLLAAALPAAAAVPATPDARAKAVGQPVALTVQPAAVVLNGPRSMQQLIVTGKYADGTLRDLTALCDLSTDGPGIASIGTEGF